MRVAQSADVYRGATLAGRLERTPHGSRFAYDERFLEEHPRDRMGVALHLPPRREPYEVRGTNLHPFFANLLPEGARLAALVHALKTSPDDLLSMLVAAGADAVGDVSAVPPGEPLREITPVADTARLGEVSFAELFAASIEYGRRGRHELATVPGVQQKISAAMVSFPVRAPRRGSLHILELEPPELPRLVHDEHFFMRAAADSGIDVARCALVHDRDGAPGLLVERFDRVAGADGSVRKLHQEDGCQLLDRYPADKYAVTLSDVARALSACDTPILEVAKLLRLHAYSYVIANGDLHAKNVSVRVSPRSGRLEMTPAYDLLSTLPYGDQHLALSMEGRDKRLRRAHFVAFGERHRVRRAATEAVLDEVCDGIAGWIPRLDEIGFDRRRTAHLARTIEQRRAHLA